MLFLFAQVVISYGDYLALDAGFAVFTDSAVSGKIVNEKSVEQSFQSNVIVATGALLIGVLIASVLCLIVRRFKKKTPKLNQSSASTVPYRGGMYCAMNV